MKMHQNIGDARRLCVYTFLMGWIAVVLMLAMVEPACSSEVDMQMVEVRETGTIDLVTGETSPVTTKAVMVCGEGFCTLGHTLDIVSDEKVIGHMHVLTDTTGMMMFGAELPADVFGLYLPVRAIGYQATELVTDDRALEWDSMDVPVRRAEDLIGEYRFIEEADADTEQVVGWQLMPVKAGDER